MKQIRAYIFTTYLLYNLIQMQSFKLKQHSSKRLDRQVDGKNI